MLRFPSALTVAEYRPEESKTVVVRFASASWAVSAKDNKFALTNKTRWRSEEYDRAWKTAETEMDPVKRAALFVKMNDLVIQNIVVIPVVFRPRVAAISNRMRDVVQSGWDGDFWALPFWSKQT